MYHHSIWQLLVDLNNKIDQQANVINEMRETISELKNSIDDQPPSKPSIEKIEYQFEQLKIETLEGTLNIGLTPQETLPFEQLEIPSEGSNQNSLTAIESSILHQLQPFITKQLPGQITQMARELDFNLSDEWKNTIFQDVQQQLPKKVKAHVGQLATDGSLKIEPERIPLLTKHIQKEILQGVSRYLEKIKENETYDGY
ncbi:hypothetical protein CEY16_00705 [Halalkalibacillus sediminis]|uniref:Uncharacterized protein n=1 Tax=Halalkalibacillus sediminis TaxID=2018042 RepID=A0A2I0QVD7_9BACI|nr:spore germination protein GerPC [Halalkalibacillus sediminis]PKR78311.1 hypothetical protein CEY16_00705 [Halalkalibacillus sediminis]